MWQTVKMSRWLEWWKLKRTPFCLTPFMYQYNTTLHNRTISEVFTHSKSREFYFLSFKYVLRTFYINNKNLNTNSHPPHLPPHTDTNMQFRIQLFQWNMLILSQSIVMLSLHPKWWRLKRFFFFFLWRGWGSWPFQAYFTYFKPIVHWRWTKTGLPGENLSPVPHKQNLSFSLSDLQRWEKREKYLHNFKFSLRILEWSNKLWLINFEI